MVLLVFVHGYNLNIGYLQPWTLPGEPLTITAFTEYWLANGIFRFRIPMLFIISGYLYAIHDSRPYGQRTRKRIRTLLVPYFIWSAVGLLLTLSLELNHYTGELLASTGMMRIDESRYFFSQFHWYEMLVSWIVSPASYQLWFLRVLFFYNLMYPWIRWCVTHPVARWFFFSFTFLAWLTTSGWFIIEGEGLLFFSLGIWIQKTNFNIDTPVKWLHPRYWVLIFVVFSIVKTMLAFGQPFQGIELVLMIMHKIVVFSGLITAWYGCDRLVAFLMKRPWFTWLSAFSFMIYVMHAPAVVYASKAIFTYIPHYPGYQMVSYIILPVILISLAIITSLLIRRSFPGVYSILTGGRGLKS